MENRVAYNIHWLPTPAVAYRIYNRKLCVFTGLIESCHGSTVNFAEDIAARIAAQEGVPVNSLRFFDLRTRTHFVRDCWLVRKPGDFDFKEVVLGGDRVTGVSWRTVQCPAYVVQDFAGHIGGVPHQREYDQREWEAEFE